MSANGIRQITQNSISVAGSSATKGSYTSRTNRKSVTIFNSSMIYDVWVKTVAKDASAPTITSTTFAYRVPPLSERTIPLSVGQDVYMQNSSGALTTVTVALIENDEAWFTPPSRTEPLLLTLTVDFTIPDTANLVAGDVMADTQSISSAFRVPDGHGTIVRSRLSDEGNVQATPGDLDWIFLSANTSIGTEDSAVGISTTNNRSVIGEVRHSAAEWVSMNATAGSGQRVITKVSGAAGLPLPVRPASGTITLYTALIARSAIDVSAFTSNPGFWRGEIDIYFEGLAA